MTDRYAALETKLRERGEAHVAEMTSLRSDNDTLRSESDALRKEVESLRDIADAANGQASDVVNELRASLSQAQYDKVRASLC